MNTMCNDENLIDLLQADDDDSMRETAEHVEHCSHCRSRIETLAADDGQWQLARRVLTSPPNLKASGHAMDNDDYRQEWIARRERPTSWTESMAKSLLSSPSHPEMMGRIGRYDVERLIGSGGMGVVFKAHDTELNRPVAVKLLAPYLAENGSARKRFTREARAAAAVVDDHVVPIHNVETDGEHPFLVMKYIAGGSLQQRLDRDGPLDVCEVLRIGMQAAKGLAAAHAQGLIHRDIKPSNILLDEGVERALLTDFGLARAEDDACLTRSGIHPGTPHYMSPEQVRGEAIDARSDLFGLGCVLYALCTGHPPFRNATSYAVLRRITDDTPRSIRESNPDVPEWLELIVMKLLAKSADDRFDSAEQVAELLEDCLAHVQQPTTTPLPAGVQALAAQTRSRSLPKNRRKANVIKLIALRLVLKGSHIVKQFKISTLLWSLAVFAACCATYRYDVRMAPMVATLYSVYFLFRVVAFGECRLRSIILLGAVASAGGVVCWLAFAMALDWVVHMQTGTVFDFRTTAMYYLTAAGGLMVYGLLGAIAGSAYGLLAYAIGYCRSLTATRPPNLG